MTYVLTERDRRRLLAWQRRMIGLFVGTWVYILLVVAVHLLLRPADVVVQLALVPVLLLIAVAGFVQFSARCPACGYRLGRQSRLVVPERCRACGAGLRALGEAAEQDSR